MNILVSELFRVARVIVIPSLILGLTLYTCDQKREVERMESNTSALIKEKYMLKKDKQVLQFNTDELKQTIASDSVLKDHLHDSLKIKDKNIRTLMTIVSKTESSFQAPLRDTAFVSVPGDTVVIHAKTFSYYSKHLQSSGIVYKDSVSIKYKHEDSATLVIHYSKKGKWFLPRLFEKAKLTASVINSDPYSNILIDKVIVKKE